MLQVACVAALYDMRQFQQREQQLIGQTEESGAMDWAGEGDQTVMGRAYLQACLSERLAPVW